MESNVLLSYEHDLMLVKDNLIDNSGNNDILSFKIVPIVNKTKQWIQSLTL